MDKTLFLSPPHMSGREFALVKEAFASNWIAPLGPMLTAFENDLSSLTGLAHVAGLSSGTAALHLALRLCEVEPGDEVWGSTLTFIGGVAPILYQRATPVFLDVDERFLLDLDLLEEELRAAANRGKLPKALITTDLYGLMADMRRLERLQTEYGFAWISDSAEAVGSVRNGRHAGKGARFAVYSFNGNKIVTTSGGGALASDNPDLIRQAIFLSTQAREPAPHYQHATIGYNYRLSNICAAIGVGQLQALRDFVDARRRNFAQYHSALRDVPGISFTKEAEGEYCNRWLTTLIVDSRQAGVSREDIRTALEIEGIESRPLWKPMHLQPLFASARYLGGSNSATFFDRGLCLPSGSAMTEADVDRVIRRIKQIVARA